MMNDFELTNPETDRISDDEHRLLNIIAHGTGAGYVVFSNHDSEIIGTENITFDHSEVGNMMRADGVFGDSVVEGLLFENLSEEQEAIKNTLDEARANEDVDLW